MIKRVTKFTGLLMSAATIMSIIPAYAADIQRVDTQDGTVYGTAKAKGNGIFVDGEIDGADEACYWLSDDGKTNKLDIDTSSIMTDELSNQYLEIDTGTKDLTYLDIKNGYKDTGYDVREDLESSVATTVKSKLRHDNNDRFDDDVLKVDTNTFQSYYNRESTISPSSGTKYVGLVSTSDGLSVFQIPLKDDLDAGITNNVKYNKGTLSSNTSTTVSNTEAIYADATGMYVDADYNLGSLKIYSGSTTGAAVNLENTKDSYDIKSAKDGKTYELKAVLSEATKGYIAEVSDTIYRWANLTIYKREKGSNDSYVPVTASDGFTFGGDDKANKVGFKVDTPVNKPVKVLQAFSKTPASDTVDGIKYSKDSTIYFVADKDGTDKSGDLLALKSGGKMKANATALCSFLFSNGTVKAENIKFAHKNSFNYLDIGDQDSSDYDSNSADSGGVPYFVNDGYLMTWDGDHSFIKFAKVDAGLDNISIGGKTRFILWDNDKNIHSIVNVPKAAKDATGATTTATTATGTATTTGAAVTVAKTGWVKNSDNTWSYQENGTKKTGWLKDNGSWYYLKSDGIMSTGWINDNGTWYYLNESGAMLSDTTIDGYTLGSDGAWIQ